jgi:hypothetical protein
VRQVALGWTGSHRYEFDIDGARYGLPDPVESFGKPCLDERRFKIGSVLHDGARAEYLCDFGDGWRYAPAVERILPGLAEGGRAEVRRSVEMDQPITIRVQPSMAFRRYSSGYGGQDFGILESSPNSGRTPRKRINSSHGQSVPEVGAPG